MTDRENEYPEEIRAAVARLVASGRYRIEAATYEDPRQVPLDAKLAVLLFGTGDRRAESDVAGVLVCEAWLEPFGLCQARYRIYAATEGDELVIISVLQVV